jgi:uncharacterized protein YecE (DUF72 family)
MSETPEATTDGRGRVLAGATSWADRSLVRDGSFYPKKTMTAAARLAHYCHRLPLAEVATTFRFPPTPDLAAQWAARTPEGFTLDVRGWSLLTGSPTLPDSLWPDLATEVKPQARDNRRLYPGHLAPDVLEECWARFSHALDPLRRTGRLGVVILRYPRWFSPRSDSWTELAAIRRRLPDTEVAVELHNRAWMDGDQCEETLGWLEEQGLSLVCIDGPPSGERALPSVVAATAEVALVRFCGRRCVEGEPWTWPYRYGPSELAEWLPHIDDLASSAREVHLLFDNTWGADAVDGATTVLELLGTAR